MMSPTPTFKQMCAVFLVSTLIFAVPFGMVSITLAAAEQQHRIIDPAEMPFDLSKQIMVDAQRISDLKERLDAHIAQQDGDHISERLGVAEAVIKTMFSRLDEINWWMRAIAGAIILGLVDRVVGIFPNGVATRRKRRAESAGE